MSQFEMRLLDKAAYARLLTELKAAQRGDADVLEAVIDACEAGLASAAFQALNVHEPWYADRWRESLARARRSAPEVGVRIVTFIATAVRCMPEYQFAYPSEGAPSPTLVMLGEEDGGLFGQLGQADSWFDELFLHLFHGGREVEGDEEVMAVLDPDDVVRLAGLVKGLTVPAASDLPGFMPEVCERACARLTALLERALASEDGAIAVVETRLL